MKIKNYINYGRCVYPNSFTSKCVINLGDVVINEANEIGVIIQIHSDNEFRTDMFGNTSIDEIRLAKADEIKQYRPHIKQEGIFKN